MKTNDRGINPGDARSKKKKGRRILRPDEKQKSKETIPVGLSAFDRFYAGLLRSEASEFLGQSKEVWKVICDRLALPTLSTPLASSYSSQKQHFLSRAALVIEEARQSLADSIRLVNEDIQNNTKRNTGNHNRYPNNLVRHGQNRHAINQQSICSMELSIRRVEHKGVSGHSLLTFVKESTPFTKDEILHLRQGTIFSCLDGKATNSIENVLLGVILPQSRDEMVASNSFVIMMFRKIKKTIKGKWKLTPIISLLSEQRKFEACMSQMVKPVPFLLPLLGIKKPTDLRSLEYRPKRNHKSNVEDHFIETNADSESDCEMLEVVDLEATFQIPRLNNMQELAAKTFLKSKSDTICLVQGPPGTGKTTLLTSVICRYIIDSRKLEHNKRCLMVCAPTNKAVTVLCSRFLNTFLDVDSCPCNVVLIGDEDKLLENDGRKRGNAFTDNPRMRESLLYTFIDTVENDYLYIRKILDKGNFGLFNRILMVARRLENLLKRKVTDAEVIMGATSIVKLIEKFTKSRQKQYPTEIINKVDLVVGMVGAWNRDTIWQEILQGADVIFCTLGSSGSSLLKKVIGEVDDLVVDEAAAATEPEIYIPFQYLPRRLLCVGDPKQLPATITSQFAEKMGLSKSLHERLMYDCNYGHIMLDTQYRMKPALSEFPSQNFYGGKLRNGGNVIRSKYRGSVSMMDCATYTLYQIDGRERQLRSGSIENEAEANAVVEIVDDLRRISCNRSRNWCSANCLRIITFYQAQVNLIRRLLNRRKLGNVLVATVDSSQGCEADFVIVSFVRSDGKVGRNSVGFLADDRRLNVALTRAKYQMICVGNIKRMSTLADGKAESVKRLAINATNRNCVHPFPFRDDSYKRPSRQNEQMNLTNKKRRLAPPGISHNSNTSPRRRMNDVDGALGDEEMVSQTAIRAHAIVDSNISSDSSSDSESSVVSTSSSSSDNTSSDSSCQDIRNCESTAQGNISTSTTEKNIESMSGFQDSVTSSVPLEDTDTDTGSIADQNLCIKKNPKPIAEESATAIDGFYGHETSAEQSSNSAAALPNTESDTKQERPTVLDNSFDSKQMMPSVLSKTETMAVFENFSF